MGETLPGYDKRLAEPDDEVDIEAEEEARLTYADEQYDRQVDAMLEARYERE